MLMAQNNSELIQYLDEKFTRVDERFDELRSELKHDINTLASAVDAYAHKADTYFQEMAALGAKVSRLEKNLEKIAQKVGIKLD